MVNYSEPGRIEPELDVGVEVELDLDETLALYKGYVEEYLSETQEQRERAREANEFRHGLQWTDSDRGIIEGRGEPCLTFNMIGGKIGSMLGAEVVGRTDPKAVGRNPGSDMESADIATASLRYVCGTEWHVERSLCRESYYVEGVMAAEVCAEEDPRPGKNHKIRVKHIPYDRQFFDQRSSFKDHRDSKYEGMVLWQDIDDAKADWKDSKEALESLDNCSYGNDGISRGDDELEDKPAIWTSGVSRRRVRIVSICCRHSGVVHVASFCSGGWLEKPRPNPYVDTDGVPQSSYVYQTCYIRPENDRCGVVEALKDPQREVNKRRSKALHLMSSKLVIADEGAVENVQEARKELHKASGWITKRKGYDLAPVDHQQQVVNNMELLQEAKAAFETIGPSEALMGQASPSASGKALETRQRSALLKYGDVLDGARQWELRVYKQVWYRIAQYWTEEDYIRITDDPNAPQYLGINVKRPVTFAEKAIQSGMDEQTLMALVQSGRIPPQQLQEVVGVEVTNNLAQLDVDIILETGPDSSSAREQQIENFMSLLGQVGPQLPPQTLLTAIEIVVELSPIESRLKKRFLDSMKPDPAAQQAEAQKQAQMEQLAKQAAALQLQKSEAEVHSEHAKADKDEAAADKLMAEAAATARNIGMPAQMPANQPSR